MIWYASWHINIAIHEMGHYISAVKTNNLRPELAGPAKQKLAQGTLQKWLWYAQMFIKIPYGAFHGVHKEAGSFHPAVKTQNLAVSAAGPRASKVLSQITFAPGIILIIVGLYFGTPAAVYIGRALFAIGAVALLDFLLSDPGKYEAFQARQQDAAATRKQRPNMLSLCDSTYCSRMLGNLRKCAGTSVELESGTTLV